MQVLGPYLYIRPHQIGGLEIRYPIHQLFLITQFYTFTEIHFIAMNFVSKTLVRELFTRY